MIFTQKLLVNLAITKKRQVSIELNVNFWSNIFYNFFIKCSPLIFLFTALKNHFYNFYIYIYIYIYIYYMIILYKYTEYTGASQ